MTRPEQNAFLETATLDEAFSALTLAGLVPERKSLQHKGPDKGALGRGSDGRGSNQQGFGHYPRPIL